jgi:hypothetical protein
MPARWAGVPAVRSNSVIHGTAENHFVDASSVEIDDLECERVSFDPVTPSRPSLFAKRFPKVRLKTRRRYFLQLRRWRAAALRKTNTIRDEYNAGDHRE